MIDYLKILKDISQLISKVIKFKGDLVEALIILTYPEIRDIKRKNSKYGDDATLNQVCKSMCLNYSEKIKKEKRKKVEQRLKKTFSIIKQNKIITEKEIITLSRLMAFVAENERIKKKEQNEYMSKSDKELAKHIKERSKQYRWKDIEKLTEEDILTKIKLTKKIEKFNQKEIIKKNTIDK